MQSVSRCKYYVGEVLCATDIMRRRSCRMLVMRFLLIPRARGAGKSVLIKTGAVLKRSMAAV